MKLLRHLHHAVAQRPSLAKLQDLKKRKKKAIGRPISEKRLLLHTTFKYVNDVSSQFSIKSNEDLAALEKYTF